MILGTRPDGSDLRLPIESATQTFAIIAIKGAGKTYAAKVMMENFSGAGVKFVALDPTGVMWGLRTGTGGTGSGLTNVVIIGGPHGDYPLDPRAGALLADVAVDYAESLVIDLSGVSKAQMREFAWRFAERLYLRQAESRRPLHVFLDEADEWLPQRVTGEQARVLGAFDDLSRRGRSRGIGVTVITQRPARLNKDILTQCEALLIMRVIGKHDRDAVKAWVDIYGDAEKQKELNRSIATLKNGEGYFWCPPWDTFERIQVRLSQTYDSSRTPKAGDQHHIDPILLPPIESAELAERMLEATARAKADDPKELKQKVAALEAELRQRPAPVAERIEVPVLREGQAEHILVVTSAITDHVRTILHAAEALTIIGESIGQKSDAVVMALARINGHVPAQNAPARAMAVVKPPVALTRNDLTDYQRSLLVAAAQRHPAESSASQLAVLSRRSRRSSTFAPNVKSLVSDGYLQSAGSGYAITEAGFAAIGGYEEPPMSPAGRLAWWLNKVSPAEATFLRVLADAYPAWLTKEELAERSGRSLTSSAFSPALRDLVARELAFRDGDRWRAADVLMK